MYPLKDRVAVITGAGRKGGIGEAIAKHLARAGSRVVLGDICEAPTDLPNAGSGQWETLVEIARDIDASGSQALPLRVDVSDADSVREMFDHAQKTFGRLDILVNNAGVAVGPAPVVQMEEEAWRRTLEINATGTFLCCKIGLPLMIQSGKGGRIVNISSLAAKRPKPFVSAYAASKAAVMALSRSLAQEVAQFGITVNAVLPGDVDTTLKRWGLQLEATVTGQSYEEVLSAAVSKVPVGRFAVPSDVANLVGFLVSAEASFITGQAYNLTGGRELT